LIDRGIRIRTVCELGGGRKLAPLVQKILKSVLVLLVHPIYLPPKFRQGYPDLPDGRMTTDSVASLS
jgi:hypothetical protein